MSETPFREADAHPSHDLTSVPFGLYSGARTVWCRRCQTSAAFYASGCLIPWSGDDGTAFRARCGDEAVEHQLRRLVRADAFPTPTEDPL